MLKGSIEDNVLTMLCWDVINAPLLVTRLTPDIFSTRAYREIAEKAISHLSTYRVPPQAHLHDLFEDRLRKGDEGKLLLMTLDAMAELQEQLQPDYVLGELDLFLDTRRLAMAIETASDHLQNGELEQAREALYVTTPPKSSGGIYLANAESTLSFMNEREEDYFPSGIPLFDEMGIRPERKTMTLFIAPAKRGKSWWLVEVGKQAILSRKSVLHITLEMSEERVAQRYVQSLYAMAADKAGAIRIPIFKRDEIGRCYDIDFDSITPDILNSDSRARVAKRLGMLNRRAKLKIKEFPTGTLTLPQLNAYLDYLQRVENFTPDMLLIDYPDLMAVSSERLRLDLGKLFQGIRGIGVARNMAVCAVTQGNRVSSESTTVKSNMVAEDYSKIGTADLVLTYSQTAQERSINLARILVANARNVKDQFITLISQSYATGQFCLDSVYMHKHIESAVSKLTGNDEAGED